MLHYKKYALLSLAGIGMTLNAWSQRQLSLRLTDENGDAVPLAKVTIVTPAKDSTSTLFRNDQPLNWPDIGDQPATVLIDAFGYQPLTLEGQTYAQLNNQPSIVITSSVEEINEVVVVGYGTNSKGKITSAISQVKADDITKYAAPNVGQMLAGKASGVLINESSGAPGANPSIEIRGVGTLTAGVNPLIVLDGLPLSEGTTLNSINPNDIETIDILKDPASEACPEKPEAVPATTSVPVTSIKKVSSTALTLKSSMLP